MPTWRGEPHRLALCRLKSALGFPSGVVLPDSLRRWPSRAFFGAKMMVLKPVLFNPVP